MRSTLSTAALAATLIACGGGDDGPRARPQVLADGAWRTLMVVDNVKNHANDVTLRAYDLAMSAEGRVALRHEGVTPVSGVGYAGEDWIDRDGEDYVHYEGAYVSLPPAYHEQVDEELVRGGPDRRVVRGTFGRSFVATYELGGTYTVTDLPVENHTLWPPPTSFSTYPISWGWSPDREVIGIDLLVNEAPVGETLPPDVPAVSPVVFRHELAAGTLQIHGTDAVFHQRYNGYVFDPAGSELPIYQRWFATAAFPDGEPVIITAVDGELIGWHLRDDAHPGAPRGQNVDGWKRIEVGGRIKPGLPVIRPFEYHPIPSGLEVWWFTADGMQIFTYTAATRTWSEPRVIASPFGGELGHPKRLASGGIAYAYTHDGRPGVVVDRGDGWEPIMDGTELVIPDAVFFGIATGGDDVLALFARDTFDISDTTPAIEYQGYALDVAIYTGRL